jgi:hypothetical protein
MDKNKGKVIAVELARLTGEKWKFNTYGHKGEEQHWKLLHPSGLALNFYSTTYPPNKTTISASGSGFYRVMEYWDRPKIGVATDRPGPAIAKDIQRRLIEDAKAWWAKEQAIVKRWSDFRAGRDVNIAKVVAVLKDARRHLIREENGRAEFTRYKNDGVGIHITGWVDNNTAEVKLNGPAAHVLKLLELGVKHGLL